MILSALIAEIDTISIPVIKAEDDLEVCGVSHDSRNIRQGEIFVALSGGSFDGHTYINDAIKKGAIAVVGEKEEISDIPIPYIRVEKSRYALAQIAAAYNLYPAKKLNVIGVTGTDGKTTTVSLIHHILTRSDIKAGMVSTVNAQIGNETVDTGFHVTTPEAQEIQSILKKMIDHGLTHVVLEATSHGLEQYRVAECYFDVGVITNITHEHLDYHGDYAHYFQSKSRLIIWLDHGVAKSEISHPFAIINQEDISYQPLKKVIENNSIENLTTISYGLSGHCDLHAQNIRNIPEGIAFDLVVDQLRFTVQSKMIGEYNVFNILAAISAAHFACGIEISAIINAVETFCGVAGRMEEIDMGQPFTAIVDFAHTPNALKVALETSRNRTENRVIAVFGSAGLRDREKRRMMAATSIQNADITIITAEDPRTEDLGDILLEMKNEGIRCGGVEGKNLFIIPDRGSAIQFAVDMALEGDLVVACGKGHEQSMCFGNTEFPWDDRVALRSALAKLLQVEGPKMPYLPTQEQ
jgi:UDP-N-acetylmuramoyl-L-alanyl-D-glutamate--2,6-diaminopimelate ligase